MCAYQGGLNFLRLELQSAPKILAACMPCLLLFGGPFRCAIAAHCGFPIYGPGLHCCYTSASTGRTCATPLGRHSQHVLTCTYAPRMQRRDHIRDAWAHPLKQAGWTVRIEQVVPVSSGGGTRRADLAATSPAGEELALDVMVTAAPELSTPPGPHLYDGPASRLPDTRLCPMAVSPMVPPWFPSSWVPVSVSWTTTPWYSLRSLLPRLAGGLTHAPLRTGTLCDMIGASPKDPAILETLRVVNHYGDSNSLPRSLGTSRKNDPILGKRPSKLRKEWNFAKFKQILGKCQNKIEEKMNPIQKWFLKISLALRK